ncbi:uncharacterized protein [Canis lupus baileyi]|uniref:uncharacterized protein isoform X1 n=2 Tax=Canis lupus baileyi TaxID=143281 RepID=UPI0018F73607
MLCSSPLTCLGGRWCSRRGVVPFLGTFLTDLFTPDTAMEEDLEGNEVNHREKSKAPHAPGLSLGPGVPSPDRDPAAPGARGSVPHRARAAVPGLVPVWDVAQRGGELHPVLPAGAPSLPPDRRGRPQSPPGLSRGAGASRGRARLRDTTSSRLFTHREDDMSLS